MMHSPFYLTVGVTALCGLWFVWDVALRSLLLDLFREEMFKLRFELFELGVAGSLPFSSETYRSMETLLNGLLRYGHRFTFLTYLFSLREQRTARKSKDYVNLAAEMSLRISQARPEVQERLRKILKQVQTAVILYISFTSLLFLAALAVALTLRLLRLVNFSSRRDVGEVLEREAYREMQRDPHLVTA